MAKKKTNGFHMFANSKRATYEQQVGRRMSQKMLLELAAVDWKNLTNEEQTAWLSRPKTSPPGGPGGVSTANCPGNTASAPGKMTGGAAPASAAVETSTALGTASNPQTGVVPAPVTPQAKTSSIHQQLLASCQHQNQNKKNAHFVEQELFKRTYRTGLDRQTAREEFYGNLLWREKDRLEDLINRRWGLVVLSAEGETLANEIVCLCVENSKIVSEMRIHRPEAQISEEQRLHPLDCLWNVEKPEDVNTACIRMNRFLQSCCYNYILVPAHQQTELSAILNQMKQTRDKLHDRDTQSIRLDRLICLEDAVLMLRKLKNLPLVNNEVDQKWEQLTGIWDQLRAVEHARAVAGYFFSCLEVETAYFDEEEEKAAAAATAGQELSQDQTQTLEGQIQLVCEEKEREEQCQRQQMEANHNQSTNLEWVTVAPDGCRYMSQGMPAPRFMIGQMMMQPLLTPPDHISPRFRRNPLPRRWIHPSESPQQPQLSPTSPAAEILPPLGPPQFSRPSRQQDVWNRPNPFSFPPQMVQTTKDIVFQSVSRWLENISIDPQPLEEDEEDELLLADSLAAVR